MISHDAHGTLNLLSSVLFYIQYVQIILIFVFSLLNNPKYHNVKNHYKMLVKCFEYTFKCCKCEQATRDECWVKTCRKSLETIHEWWLKIDKWGLMHHSMLCDMSLIKHIYFDEWLHLTLMNHNIHCVCSILQLCMLMLRNGQHVSAAVWKIVHNNLSCC